ncbi:surface carbohydrate biosynthesis protein [Nisaea sp.]|uniref:surface carbohydrate biosynthesis protein n=1 Tax=Nisaea sp. TaxID=2024842 RepID=UPI003B52457C
MAHKYLYLPIEEAARELDARLLLAVQALGKGYDVVIGQQWLLIRNLHLIEPGTFFFKGTNAIQANWMRYAKASGHKVVAIDEEVTAIAEEKHVIKGVRKEIFEYCDRFFMQGENQSRIYQKYFGRISDICRVTGNPRFDLLRGERKQAFFPAAKDIRERHGRYILLNSNFGCYNSAWGSFEAFVDVCKNVGFADWDNPEDRRWFKASYELEKHTMDGFIKLARRLREEFEQHRILIRPHPAENLETWHKLFGREDGIDIVYEGSAVPWILASDYFIHNTCTTGTEAMLLKVPVGAYAPFTNWKEQVFLSNLVTPVYRNEDDVIAATAAAISDRKASVAKIDEDYSALLEEHIMLDGADTAAARILNEIDAVAIESGNESMLRPGREMDRSEELTEYQRKKINLTLKEVSQRVVDMAMLMGMKLELKVKNAGESLFHISALRQSPHGEK